MVPPKIKLSKNDLEGWIKETTEIKEKRLQVLSESDQNKFQHWIRDQQTKVAPGYTFDSSVMVPSKPTNVKDTSTERRHSQREEHEPSKGLTEERELNELDEIFGRTTI